NNYFSIWPIFETRDILGEKYTTHVHSDHVELFMELGVSYILILGVFFGLILRNAFISPLTQSACIAMAAIILHAFVDYHLRTTAISTVFAFLAAIVFTGRAHMDSAFVNTVTSSVAGKKTSRKRVRVRKTEDSQ
ncbi:MAG: hypothetical protein ABJO72_09980, partial [Hyphomicrobiales bacterium]